MMRYDVWNKSSLLLFRYPALTISGFSALLFMPAFLWGAGGADLHCQSLWVKFFSEQFWQGELYPRWLQDMFAGNGSPVFFYYPPLTYFITAFLHFLSPLDAFGYYPIAASAVLSATLSGITFYIWAQGETGSAPAALAGSLLYIAAPNHLAQNFYYALLFSSLWAYVWLPLLLLFAKNIAQARPYSVVGFSGVLCLLIMTNIPMTIIFFPLAVAYGILSSDRINAGLFIRLTLATLGGLGLSGIYLVPSLYYMDFSNVAWHWNIVGKLHDYRTSSLFMGFDNTASKLYTLYFAGVAILAIVYLREIKKNKVAIFFGSMVLASLLMMTPISRPLWDYVSVVRMIQMSERFFAVPALCLALLAALAWPRLQKMSILILALYIGITCIAAWNTRITLDAYGKADPEAYERYKLNIDQYAYYLTSPDLIRQYYTKSGIVDVKAHQEKTETISGDAKVQVRQWSPRYILLSYEAGVPSVLRLRQLDFPGFQAVLDGRELAIRRDERTGQIMLDVPEGAGEVQIQLTRLLPETTGMKLSVFSMILLCFLAGIGWKYRVTGRWL